MRRAWVKEAFLNYAISPGLIWSNIKWRLPKTTSQKKYVFIVGAPRSGTTLIQAILNAHPGTYGFDYETSMFANRNIFDARRYERVLPEKEIRELFEGSSDVVDFFDQFVAKLTRGQELLVIEKTPHHITRLNFILKHFPESRVLHVHRDGRDSYCSARDYKGIRQARSLRSYARYWRRCIHARRKVGQDDRIFDIRYEEFTESPERILKGVLAFIGLDYFDDILNPESYGKYFRATSVNFTNLSKPISTSRQGRWKKDLLPVEWEQFEEIAGPELQYLGYRLSGSLPDAAMTNSN